MPEFNLLKEWNINGFNLQLTTSILYQWIAMAIIMITVMVIRPKKLETIPKGVQNALEAIIGFINKMVTDIMGEKFASHAPYMGTIMIYLLFLNWLGMIGLEPPTADYSVALGWALASFIVINATTIKQNGILHYFTAYASPVPFLLPLNIIERLTVPVSLSLRLFGNVTASAVVMKLTYKAFGHFSRLAHLQIGIAKHFSFSFLQIAFPIPLHLYFDMFDGTIQMIIFLMLTMVFTKTTSEH